MSEAGPAPPAPSGAETLDSRRVHDGFFAFDVLRLRHERFGGGWTPPLRRELLRQRETVVVLPFDHRTSRVALVEQFRAGPFATGRCPWLVEAPAGIAEPGEPPEAVARRELLEECAVQAGRLERALVFWSSPGASTELVHVFVAEAALAGPGGLFGCEHEGEDIRAHVLDLDEALAWLDSGRVAGASGVIALQWLRVHRQRLTRLWAA